MAFKNIDEIRWLINQEAASGTDPLTPSVPDGNLNRPIYDVAENTINNQNRISTLETDVANLENDLASFSNDFTNLETAFNNQSSKMFDLSDSYGNYPTSSSTTDQPITHIKDNGVDKFRMLSLTTNKVVISNNSGGLGTSSITTTELGHLSGASSNIQTQLNGLNLNNQGILKLSYVQTFTTSTTFTVPQGVYRMYCKAVAGGNTIEGFNSGPRSYFNLSVAAGDTIISVNGVNIIVLKRGQRLEDTDYTNPNLYLQGYYLGGDYTYNESYLLTYRFQRGGSATAYLYEKRRPGSSIFTDPNHLDSEYSADAYSIGYKPISVIHAINKPKYGEGYYDHTFSIKPQTGGPRTEIYNGTGGAGFEGYFKVNPGDTLGLTVGAAGQYINNGFELWYTTGEVYTGPLSALNGGSGVVILGW